MRGATCDVRTVDPGRATDNSGTHREGPGDSSWHSKQLACAARAEHMLPAAPRADGEHDRDRGWGGSRLSPPATPRSCGQRVWPIRCRPRSFLWQPGDGRPPARPVVGHLELSHELKAGSKYHELETRVPTRPLCGRRRAVRRAPSVTPALWNSDDRLRPLPVFQTQRCHPTSTRSSTPRTTCRRWRARLESGA